MKYVKMPLSVNGVENVKKKFERLQKDFLKANNQIQDDMVKELITQITNNYNSSPYTDGNNDTQIFKRKKGTKIRVGARGSQVLYREFGTGTEGLNAPHPMKNDFNLKGYNTGPKIRVNPNTGDLFWIYKNEYGEKVYTQGIPAGKEVFNASIILKGKKYTIIKKRVSEALSKL